jgi:hypothetical protein
MLKNLSHLSAYAAGIGTLRHFVPQGKAFLGLMLTRYHKLVYPEQSEWVAEAS